MTAKATVSALGFNLSAKYEGKYRVKQYYQCRLQRGAEEKTGWIEARGAKLGATVELLPSGEVWTVAQVYDHGLPADVLKETQRLNRKSLPSVQAMG